MSRALYSLVWYLATPLVMAYLLWRSRRQPAYREHWAERFGIDSGAAGVPGPAAAPGSPGERALIWLHAVSVGETRAAESLIAALLERFPEHDLLLTQMTPTGREAAGQMVASRWPGRVHIRYLPYDYPHAVARFLEHYRPVAGILMETELWPNLIAAAERRGVPLALVNARLSPRSLKRARRFEGIARRALASFALIAAQTEGDAERLRSLGAAAVIVTGNLKFDQVPAADLVALGRTWRALWERPRVLVAASTREGEEALLLAALARNPDPGRLTVLVPRHPQRFDAVAAMVAASGLTLARRSQTSAPAAAVDVWLGDSMGEMPAYYAAADVAFVGGSLLPLGGQNLIEACACGVPVLVGPHTFNFADATEQAIAAGAARRVADADEMIAAAAELLADSIARTRASAAALAFSSMHGGATARTIAALMPLVPSVRTS